MFISQRVSYAAMPAAFAGLIFTALSPLNLSAQQSAEPALPSAEPTSIALALPENRGEVQLEQTLKRLGTTASVLMIVAHPDDEDGALLTYLSRGLGVACHPLHAHSRRRRAEPHVSRQRRCAWAYPHQ